MNLQIAPTQLLPPNVCFICEAGRNEGEVWIDTQRNFEGSGFNALNGRKYICERCATESAGFLGLVSKVALEQETIRANQAESVLRAVRGELDVVVGHIKMLSTHGPQAAFENYEETDGSSGTQGAEAPKRARVATKTAV